jgi:hypothetical protein
VTKKRKVLWHCHQKTNVLFGSKSFRQTEEKRIERANKTNKQTHSRSKHNNKIIGKSTLSQRHFRKGILEKAFWQRHY